MTLLTEKNHPTVPESEGKLDFHAYNDLGQLLDTTWGKSSIHGDASSSIKAQLVGKDRLQVTYTTIIVAKDQQALEDQYRELSKRSVGIVSKYLSSIAKDYKEKTDKSIDLKVVSDSDNIEIIEVQSHVNKKRTAYYRRQSLVSVS